MMEKKEKNKFARSPTLDTVIMIEKTIEKLEQNDKSIGDHSSRIEEIEKKVFAFVQ